MKPLSSKNLPANAGIDGRAIWVTIPTIHALIGLVEFGKRLADLNF